jgi:hypothetical protein
MGVQRPPEAIDSLMERIYADQKCRACAAVIEKGESIVLVAYGDTPSPYPSMAQAHGAMSPTGQDAIRFTPKEEWFHLKCYRALTTGSGGSSTTTAEKA